jgi:formylglycine-generating enzyme required for sulfatase activity
MLRFDGVTPRARALTVIDTLLAIAISCAPFDVAETPGEPTSDAGAADSTASADGARSDPSCPDTGRGPTMVRVGQVCIDSTPVTIGQYKDFLKDFLAAPGNKSFAGEECGQSTGPTDVDRLDDLLDAFSNSSCRFLSDAPKDVFQRRTMPAVCVTICDARAFCEWAGKHLCAGLDGKPQKAVKDIGPNDIGPDRDEWTHVCTENGQHDFSKGKTWEPSGCIVKESGLESPQPVDREGGCEGPPGVFDLIGNVVVWIDACGETSEGKKCRLAGESSRWRADKSVGLGNANAPGRCDAIDDNYPTDRQIDIGFRCCATPK